MFAIQKIFPWNEVVLRKPAIDQINILYIQCKLCSSISIWYVHTGYVFLDSEDFAIAFHIFIGIRIYKVPVDLSPNSLLIQYWTFDNSCNNESF